MNIIKQNKTVFIGAVILISILIFYGLSSKPPSAQHTTSTPSQTENTGEREMLEMLADMKTIRLDGRIFESSTYMNLQDFSREIVPEPIGRQDPFAPLEDTEVTITGGEELLDQALLR
ncbi:MAG: hypothetical protein LRZ97_01970 [Candidatus Pacebacteria bacterium]|nr:hypothetical protein [Candidatus Paceibacterota bacterium]